MSRTMCAVRGCEHPVGDQAYICSRADSRGPGCTERLRAALVEAPGLQRELVVTRSRQAKVGESAGGKPAESALPFHQAAGDALRQLRAATGGWALWISDQRGIPVTAPSAYLGPLCLRCEHRSCRAIQPAITPDVVCQWLLGQVEWIRHQLVGARVFEEITTAVHRSRRVVDLPGDRMRMEVGGCPEDVDGAACTGQVWAVLPAVEDRDACASMSCTVCAARWDATQWRRAGRRIRERAREIRRLSQVS